MIHDIALWLLFLIIIYIPISIGYYNYKTYHYKKKNMKVLTNLEKIKIIELAIKRLETKANNCICDAIYHVYNEIYNENSNYTITFKLIPEILKYEPKRKYIDKDGWQTGYWWSPYNTKIRIKTLEKVIEDLSK